MQTTLSQTEADIRSNHVMVQLNSSEPLWQIPLFKDLNKAEQRLISREMRLHKKTPGTELLIQGQPVQAVYIIKDGIVDVLVNDDRVAQRGPLDSLGEMSCLSGEENASATVRVVSPCLVWEIDRNDFLKVIDAIPILRAQLHSTITNRLQALSHRFSEILKHIPHGIVKIDLDGTITDEFSSRCTDYLGIKQLSGRKLGSILFSDNRTLAEKWECAIQSFASDADSSLISKLSHLPEELTYRHPEGGERIFRLYYHLTSNKLDEITGLDIGIDDVTQKRQYQSEISSFHDLITNMEQMLVMIESRTGLILQETISHSNLGQLHFPTWKKLKGKHIMESILNQQDRDQKAHFQKWLNMLHETFILETMSREELVDLAPRFVYETVAGNVVELSFNLNPGHEGQYDEVLGKFEFVEDEPDEAGTQVSTMILMEEIVSAEAEHQSGLSEALNEMQISLEFAQSQMVTPNSLIINHRQIAGLFHSVKGLAQSFGVQTIVSAAHDLEDILEDTIKSGQNPMVSEQLLSAYKSLLSLIVVSKSLCSSDHVRDLGHLRSRGPEICIPMELYQQIKKDFKQVITAHKPHPDDIEASNAFNRLRSTISSLELMRASAIFPRLEKIVADTAGLLNKQVAFNVDEKKVVHLPLQVGHTLSTCLIQLIKNAVFHGIEAVPERRFLGKPEKARVDLIITQDEEHVFICVRDDGKGLNSNKILERAVQLDLIDESSAALLQEQETSDRVFSLIFKPGFSTAGSVSLISGRGVGMSLIKTEIEALGGSVQVKSKENRGTEVFLRIPIEAEPKTQQSKTPEF